MRKKKAGDDMADKEVVKTAIEEFSRLQLYMTHTGKDSDGYKFMKNRYIELKVMLNSFGVNLTELDIIKE